MKNLTKESRLKSVPQFDFSKIIEQQKMISYKRIANLSFMNDVKGINEIRRNLESVHDPKVNTGSQHEVRSIQPNDFEFCIRPPYFGSFQSDSDNPIDYESSELIRYLRSPYVYLNKETGDISMAVMAGRDRKIIYRPLTMGIIPFRHVQATFFHPIESFPHNTNYRWYYGIDIDFGAVLPSWELVKDDLFDRYQSIVGVEGFILIFALYSNETDPGMSPISRYDFLSAFKTPSTLERIFDKKNLFCTGNFIIPAHAVVSRIFVTANLNAYFYKDGPIEDLNSSNYSLIDFRSGNYKYNRLQENFPGRENHPITGPIRVKSICYSNDYFTHPDTH